MNDLTQTRLDLYTVLAESGEDGRAVFDEECLRTLSREVQSSPTGNGLFGGMFVGPAIDNGHHDYLRDWLAAELRTDSLNSLMWPDLDMLTAVVVDDPDLLRQAVSLVPRIGPYRRSSLMPMLEILVRCGLYGEVFWQPNTDPNWALPALSNDRIRPVGPDSAALICASLLGMPRSVARDVVRRLDGHGSHRMQGRRPSDRSSRDSCRLLLSDFQSEGDLSVLRKTADWFCGHASELGAPAPWLASCMTALADGLSIGRPSLRRRLRQAFQDRLHRDRGRHLLERAAKDAPCAWDRANHPSIIWHTRGVDGTADGGVRWERALENAIALRSPGITELADSADRLEADGKLLHPLLAAHLLGELAVSAGHDRPDLLRHASASLRAEADVHDDLGSDGSVAILRAVADAAAQHSDPVPQIKSGLRSMADTHPNSSGHRSNGADSIAEGEDIIAGVCAAAVSDQDSCETAICELIRADGRWDHAVYAARLLQTGPCIDLTDDDREFLAEAQYPLGLIRRVARGDSITDDMVMRLIYPENLARVAYGGHPASAYGHYNARRLLTEWLTDPPERVHAKISTLSACILETGRLNQSLTTVVRGRRDGDGRICRPTVKPRVSIAEAVAVACDLMDTPPPDWARVLPGA